MVKMPASDNVNEWDDLGMTPLLYAVFRGDVEGVRQLLEAGADPNLAKRDDRTATPLWHARDDFGLHEIAEVLIRAGAK
jgi:ankyrin repeat protein